MTTNERTTPQAVINSPAPAARPEDDLGIDRAFLMMLARLPLIAGVFVILAWLSHQVWASLAPPESILRNLGPLIVVCAGMVLAAVIDGWAFKVPNWLTLSLVLSGWVLGLLHSFSVSIDGGVGGIGSALLGTAVGFALLGPLLAISGMGQGDVKMTMGFGSWIGAYFGMADGMWVLIWAFALGAVIGGVFGLVMMIARRRFGQNAKNFREIFTDLRVLVTAGPGAACQRSEQRRSRWDRLPYGIPLCVGFLGYLWYLYISESPVLRIVTG
jgi:prepilin peptidase CpaA